MTLTLLEFVGTTCSSMMLAVPPPGSRTLTKPAKLSSTPSQCTASQQVQHQNRDMK